MTFNESIFISVATYNCAIIATIICIIQLVLAERNPFVAQVIYQLGTLFIIIFSLSIIYLPRLRLVYNYTDGERDTRREKLNRNSGNNNPNNGQSNTGQNGQNYGNSTENFIYLDENGLCSTQPAVSNPLHQRISRSTLHNQHMYYNPSTIGLIGSADHQSGAQNEHNDAKKGKLRTKNDKNDKNEKNRDSQVLLDDGDLMSDWALVDYNGSLQTAKSSSNGSTGHGVGGNGESGLANKKQKRSKRNNKKNDKNELTPVDSVLQFGKYPSSSTLSTDTVTQSGIGSTLSHSAPGNDANYRHFGYNFQLLFRAARILQLERERRDQILYYQNQTEGYQQVQNGNVPSFDPNFVGSQNPNSFHLNHHNNDSQDQSQTDLNYQPHSQSQQLLRVTGLVRLSLTPVEAIIGCFQAKNLPFSWLYDNQQLLTALQLYPQILPIVLENTVSQGRNDQSNNNNVPSYRNDHSSGIHSSKYFNRLQKDPQLLEILLQTYICDHLQPYLALMIEKTTGIDSGKNEETGHRNQKKNEKHAKNDEKTSNYFKIRQNSNNQTTPAQPPRSQSSTTTSVITSTMDTLYQSFVTVHLPPQLRSFLLELSPQCLQHPMIMAAYIKQTVELVDGFKRVVDEVNRHNSNDEQNETEHKDNLFHLLSLFLSRATTRALIEQGRHTDIPSLSSVYLETSQITDIVPIFCENLVDKFNLFLQSNLQNTASSIPNAAGNSVNIGCSDIARNSSLGGLTGRPMTALTMGSGFDNSDNVVVNGDNDEDENNLSRRGSSMISLIISSNPDFYMDQNYAPNPNDGSNYDHNNIIGLNDGDQTTLNDPTRDSAFASEEEVEPQPLFHFGPPSSLFLTSLPSLPPPQQTYSDISLPNLPQPNIHHLSTSDLSNIGNPDTISGSFCHQNTGNLNTANPTISLNPTNTTIGLPDLPAPNLSFPLSQEYYSQQTAQPLLQQPIPPGIINSHTSIPPGILAYISYLESLLNIQRQKQYQGSRYLLNDQNSNEEADWSGSDGPNDEDLKGSSQNGDKGGEDGTTQNEIGQKQQDNIQIPFSSPAHRFHATLAREPSQMGGE